MLWILSIAAFAGNETNCNGIDDDFDGAIDEGAPCGTAVGPCEHLQAADGTSFLSCPSGIGEIEWDHAASECDLIGYTLATPRDIAEDDLIIDSLNVEVPYWIGITDSATEGDWLDMDGVGIDYDNWAPGEPSGGVTANCGAYATDLGPVHQWYAYGCFTGAVEAFVCEARCNPVTYYEDPDGDTWGSGTAMTACNARPTGTVGQGGDCGPTSASVYPGASDATCNGVDNDCDGHVDEDAMGLPWYRDHDDDGAGDVNDVVYACEQPVGYVESDDDCDDADASRYPAALEICDGIDNDCNGTPDDGLTTTTYYADQDDDDYGDALSTTASCASSPPPGYTTDASDCDDDDPNSYPGASELCDGADNDCDGHIDENALPSQWYEDGDDDGWGDGSPTTSCDPPTSTSVLQDGDCDDADPAINPGAHEVCDAVDHDCDGQDWNGLTLTTFYPDVDQDGFGAGSSVTTCETSQPGYVANGSDCNDSDEHINPDAIEICDGIDNDCDTLVDDADTVPDPDVWFPDVDDDGYGADGQPILACTQPPQTVDRDGDCDDAEPNVFIGAPEACVDGLDNDCDLLVDADDPDFVNGGVAYAQDADDDGFGDPFVSALACSGDQPLGWVPLSRGEDCDDGSSLRNPGLTEDCDGIDNDCDGTADNGLPFLDYYVDDDGDGFGDPGPPTINACEAPVGRTGNGLDCNDDDASVNPTTPEVCNGVDDNCNNLADDGLDTEVYYVDADEDGFGDLTDPGEESCDVVSGAVLDNTDCDDTDGSVYPGATEIPDDGIDSNCDGAVEEVPPTELPDTDGDGVPDIIDLVDATDRTPPSPTPQDYGCGCTQAPRLSGWLGFWRRR